MKITANKQLNSVTNTKFIAIQKPLAILPYFNLPSHALFVMLWLWTMTIEAAMQKSMEQRTVNNKRKCMVADALCIKLSHTPIRMRMHILHMRCSACTQAHALRLCVCACVYVKSSQLQISHSFESIKWFSFVVNNSDFPCQLFCI